MHRCREAQGCARAASRQYYSGHPALRPSGHLRCASMFKIVPDNFVSNPWSQSDRGLIPTFLSDNKKPRKRGFLLSGGEGGIVENHPGFHPAGALPLVVRPKLFLTILSNPWSQSDRGLIPTFLSDNKKPRKRGFLLSGGDGFEPSMGF